MVIMSIVVIMLLHLDCSWTSIDCKILRYIDTKEIIQCDEKSDEFCVIVENLLGDKSAK